MKMTSLHAFIFMVYWTHCITTRINIHYLDCSDMYILWFYCIQGKFHPHFIFNLFALWPEGEFKTGLIELCIKNYATNLERGQIQDWSNLFQISIGQNWDWANSNLYTESLKTSCENAVSNSIILRCLPEPSDQCTLISELILWYSNHYHDVALLVKDEER